MIIIQSAYFSIITMAADKYLPAFGAAGSLAFVSGHIPH
ncbi:hypothetical protein CVH13_01829, partial [Dehalococcoides mccartyi]